MFEGADVVAQAGEYFVAAGPEGETKEAGEADQQRP